MLHPSYSELMNAFNDLAPETVSRYTVVIATSKRAKQLTDGEKPKIKPRVDRAVSIAVDEINQGKLRIIKKAETDPEG